MGEAGYSVWFFDNKAAKSNEGFVEKGGSNFFRCILQLSRKLCPNAEKMDDKLLCTLQLEGTHVRGGW